MWLLNMMTVVMMVVISITHTTIGAGEMEPPPLQHQTYTHI